MRPETHFHNKSRIPFKRLRFPENIFKKKCFNIKKKKVISLEKPSCLAMPRERRFQITAGFHSKGEGIN